jgi:lipopolysaccharide/colanic/teichoic acid biosynthesis glycosyltransferase
MHVMDEGKNRLLLTRLAALAGGSARVCGRTNRVSDIMQYSFAAIGLVLMAPLFLVIGLLIKLTSPGPLLYRGLRVGRDGRIFTIYKFRTLQVDAEEKIGARLLTDRDVYYTRLGKFMKRAKLDELPQLLNVLKGEMNLVGPRPIRPIFLEPLCRDIPRYPIRFAVKPGMTGLAQVRGGYFTAPKDKLRYELIYIKNRSLLLDLKLIVLTLVGIPREFSTGPFSGKTRAKPHSSSSNSPVSHHRGNLRGRRQWRTDDSMQFAMSHWAVSAELSCPARLGFDMLRAVLEKCRPFVKP